MLHPSNCFKKVTDFEENYILLRRTHIYMNNHMQILILNYILMKQKNIRKICSVIRHHLRKNYKLFLHLVQKNKAKNTSQETNKHQSYTPNDCSK